MTKLTRDASAIAAVLCLLAGSSTGQEGVKPPSALRFVGEFDVGQGGEVTSLAFSADGRMLAAGSDAGEVIVSCVQTGERIVRLLGARETPKLVFSPDGRRLATVGEHDLRVFTIPGGAMVASREVFAQSTVAWSPDGAALAGQVSASDVGILAADDLSELRRIPLGDTGGVDVMTFDATGQHLVVVQSLRGLLTIDLRTGEREPLARGHLSGAISLEPGRWLVTHETPNEPETAWGVKVLGRARGVVAAPATGQFLVMGAATTWRNRDGDLLCTLPRSAAAALSPRGNLAAVARHGIVRLMTPDGSVVRELRGHRACPDQVVVAGGGPHGGRTVLATAQGVLTPGSNLFVYDVSSGHRHLVPLPTPARALRSARASPDVLIVGQRSLLWHPRARRTTFDLGHSSVPSTPVWSPDARWIWTGHPRTFAARGEVDTVFDLATRVEREFATPDGSEPLAWRPDGGALLLVHQVANCFGGGSGDLLLTVRGGLRARVPLSSLVYGAAWSPDGASVALATSDGIMILGGDTLATKATGPRGCSWVRFLDASHVVCSVYNRVTVLRADSGEVVLTQKLRAGLDGRAPDCFDLIGPPGDASADGRVVVATDGVGVLVFEVDH